MSKRRKAGAVEVGGILHDAADLAELERLARAYARAEGELRRLKSEWMPGDSPAVDTERGETVWEDVLEGRLEAAEKARDAAGLELRWAMLLNTSARGGAEFRSDAAIAVDGILYAVSATGRVTAGIPGAHVFRLGELVAVPLADVVGLAG